MGSATPDSLRGGARRRIAIFLPALEGGGAERAVLRLARGMVRRDLVVELVVPSAGGQLQDEVPAEVRLVDLGARRTLGAFVPLARHLRRSRPDGLISALDHANVVALAAVRVARTRTPTVVSLRNPMPPNRRIIAALAWVAYRLADRCVAISEGVAASLERWLPGWSGRLTVVYNPVDPDELRAAAAEPLAHPWFGDNEIPVILGAGRLRREKDFGTLLRAFALVRQRRRARLVILGEGPRRQALERLAGDLGIAADVAFPGFEANPYRWMGRASVFVLSSRAEGLGNVLLEALALDVPVVSTDSQVGPSEILEGGRWGRLVPVGDWPALGRAIEATLDAPHTPVPAEALERFSVDTAVDGYLEMLGDADAVVARPGPERD